MSPADRLTSLRQLQDEVRAAVEARDEARKRYYNRAASLAAFVSGFANAELRADLGEYLTAYTAAVAEWERAGRAAEVSLDALSAARGGIEGAEQEADR